METCCIESFAKKGIREMFRLGEEGEGHTCEACGRVYRIVNGTWTLASPVATTATVYTATTGILDMQWAKATMNPEKGTMTIQCWGCGGARVVPMQIYNELHFDHADPHCSLARALVNRSKRFMPAPKVH